MLLEVRASAVCGSDVHRYLRGHRTYPMIMGHEAAGIVSAIGPGVDESLRGRHAALIPLVPCHACAQCRAGRFSACATYSFIGSRRDGAFAQLVALPASNLLLVPDDLPFEAAALIEPSTVARHMLDLGHFRSGRHGRRASGPDRSASCSSSGCGSSARGSSWSRTSSPGTARQPGRSARTLTLDPAHDDVPAEVVRLTGGGADLVLEATGSPAALGQTIEVARPRGAIVLGGNQPLDASLPMTFVEGLMRKELTLTGGFMSYSAPWPGHEWTDGLVAVLDGGLDTAAMISHRAPLSEAPDLFAEIAAHRLTHRKIVFDPSS